MPGKSAPVRLSQWSSRSAGQRSMLRGAFVDGRGGGIRRASVFRALPGRPLRQPAAYRDWLARRDDFDRPGDLAECLPDLGHVLSAGRLFCQLSGLPPTVFVTRPASLRSPS